MISCTRHHLAARCLQRGYTIEEVLPCIVGEDGDLIVVDPSHPSYPRERRAAPKAIGAGTHLKRLFAKLFRLTASEKCSCNKVAAQMDTMGPKWCRDNLDWILDQIRENADKRGLPFIRGVVSPIVLLAIRRAERDQKAGK